jgi:hypothetical protein
VSFLSSLFHAATPDILPQDRPDGAALKKMNVYERFQIKSKVMVRPEDRR